MDEFFKYETNKTLYSKIFIVLDYCYWQCKNESLGIVLGQLSCDLWSDGTPTDIETCNELLDIICATKGNDIYTKALAFLYEYPKRYPIFNFDSVRKVLENMDSIQIDELIERGIQR